MIVGNLAIRMMMYIFHVWVAAFFYAVLIIRRLIVVVDLGRDGLALVLKVSLELYKVPVSP